MRGALNMKRTDFLNALGNASPICLSNHNKIITLNNIESLNGTHELHYIPNLGGTKADEITQFKTFFIDLDSGRDKNGDYFPLSKVSEYKEQKQKQLEAFPIYPSAVIETRNGLQVYWFIGEPISRDSWQRIENALIAYFNADIKVKSPANQMRLPDTFWVKDKNNPFYCKIISLHKRSYFKKDFDFLDIEKISSIKLNPEKFKKILTSKTFYNYQDLFDHITKEVDLFQYLRDFYDLEAQNINSFKCIAHNDNNPSASVFKSKDGIWLYSCRATSCDFKIGNIIQVVQHLSKLPRHLAIQKICSDLGLEFTEDAEQKRILEDNLKVIKDDIKYSHPKLYSVIYRYIPTLTVLHYLAMDNLVYANNEDQFLFTGSTRHLARMLGRHDKKRTGEDLSFLSLAKMLKKVDIESDTVPSRYRDMVMRLKRENERYINTYSIPAYTLEHLRKCEDFANVIIEKGIRKIEFCYATVANAFGSELADEIFPQAKNTVCKDLDMNLYNVVENLIAQKSYVTEKIIREYYKEHHMHWPEKTFICQMPIIITKLGLVKIRTNKKLKEQYGIISSGYPNIFIKKETALAN